MAILVERSIVKSDRVIRTESNPLNLLIHIANGGKQFIARDSRCAEFSHHHARTGIGQNRGFSNGNAGRDGKRKHRKDRIARSGHVENLASVRGAIDSCLPQAGVADFAAHCRHMETFRRGIFKHIESVATSRYHHG